MDTFDGRIRRAGLALAREGGRIVLRDAGDGEPVATCAWRRSQPPRLAGELPAGELRDRIGPVMGPRALAPTFAAQIVQAGFELRDRAGDPGAVVRWERITIARGRARDRLELLVAGDDRRPAGRSLVRAGFRPSPRGWHDELRRAARAREPLRPRPDTRVPAGATLRVLAVVIFRHLLRVMEQNEPGVREGIDPEFLHDFRVALRRTRAGLARMDGVLPAAGARGFRERFGAVARACSGLRDLDVMRLDLAARADDVPSALRAGMVRLQSEVEHDRAAEVRAFNAVLAGDDWRRLKRDWRVALRALASGAPMGVDAEEPAGPLLGRALRRRYERVGELVREAATGDGAALHRLRIGCKKLRYTIEFAAVMDREADELLASLSGIQDALGELNDLRVQEARLQAALAASPGPGPEAATRAAAIGALLAILERRRRRLARRCGDRLDDLSRRGFARALDRVAAAGG